jgi:sugar lactone lactonase YvrE
MNRANEILIAFAAGLLLVVSAAAQQDTINTVIGSGPNAMPAVNANVYYAYEVATDAAGNFYYTAAQEGRVYKATPGGNVTLIAGIGGQNAEGYNGDGIPATSAQLNQPQGIFVDTASPPNVYIADTNNCLIRKVNGSTGIITTVAGYTYTDTGGNLHASICEFGSYTDNKGNGFSSTGDGGKATLATISFPVGVAVDASGNIYIADTSNGRIREVSASTGNISTVAGGGGSTTAANNCGGSSPWGDGGAATNAYICSPQAVAVDSSVSPPNIFLAHYGGGACEVREVVGGTGATAGNIYRVAGSASSCGFSGDGSSATSALLNDDWQVWTQSSGGTTTVTVADYGNSRIRQFTVNSSGTPVAGNISTIAGGGSSNCTNENIPAIESCLQPIGVAFDKSGNYFIGDYGYERVREVSKSTGNINTVAGWGYPFYPYPINNTVPLGTDYQLYYPFHIRGDSTGDIYLAGYQDQSVFAWNSSTGAFSLVTGNGTSGYQGDTVTATNSTIELNNPTDVVKDSNGNIYISDYNNCVIREVVASTGDIHTVVGGTDNNRFGCGFEDGSLSVGKINGVYAMDVDSNNNLYLADSSNARVREVNFSAGTITTIAGNGIAGYKGDGGAATSAELSTALYGLAVDSAGDVYILDTNNLRVREVAASTGNIQTVAGNGTAGYQGDGVPATDTALYYPEGIAIDAAGDLLIADYDNQRIRLVDTAGIIHTIAGTGTAGYTGNGGLATSAELYYPVSVTTDSSGNIYETDYYNWAVRQISALSIASSAPASATFETQLVHTTSNSVELTIKAAGTVNISSIAASSGFTEIDDCPATLNNGQSCAVDVAFSPTTVGDINGSLTISYNGYLAPSLIVPLQGTATALSISPNPLAFSSQPVTTSVTKTITVKGATTYSASPVSLLGDTTDFSIASNTCTGAVTTSCTVGITFDPQSPGAKKTKLIIKDNDPTSPQIVSITGTGSSYESFTPASVTFKTQVVGTTSKATTVTFKYAGSGSITLSSAATASSSYVLTSNTCTSGAVLATGGTCTFGVEFAPSTSTLGVVTGTVTVNFSADPNGQTTAQLPLTGTATEVSISPASLAFGTVTSGTSTKSITLTNKGTMTLTFSGTPTITGTGSAQFTVLTGTSTCLNGSVTMTQGKSCTIQVQFTSTGKGVKYSENLSISDNDGASPQIVKITATD